MSNQEVDGAEDEAYRRQEEWITEPLGELLGLEEEPGDPPEDPPNPGRKKPVLVAQHLYLDYLETHGPSTIEEMAEHFGVHIGTARNKLEGLCYQGKVSREWRSPWQTSLYWIKGRNTHA